MQQGRRPRTAEPGDLLDAIPPSCERRQGSDFPFARKATHRRPDPSSTPLADGAKSGEHSSNAPRFGYRAYTSLRIFTSRHCKQRPRLLRHLEDAVIAGELARGLGGRPQGNGWVARCPAHDDKTPSLSIADGESGTLLVHCLAGCSQAAVIEALRSRNLWDSAGSRPDLPPGVAAQVTEGGRTFTFARLWTYRSASGDVLGYVARYENPAAGKTIRPYFVESAGTWTMRSAGTPRPLYGLDRLATHPELEVVVTEGEKAADAAGRLLPDFVAVSWPGGAKAVKRADWSPLAGRTVAIWSDNDEPGRLAGAEVVEALAGLGCSVAWVNVEALGLPTGGDAADLPDLPDGELPRIAPPTAMCLDNAIRNEPDERLCWSLRELLERPVELPPPVVPKIAWPGRVTVLAAREKAGKSTLAGAAAAKVTRGERFLGLATTPGVVLWATEEHTQDVARRLSGFGADPDKLYVMVWRHDALAEIRADAQRLRPILVVIDTLAAVAEAVAPESGSSSQWAKVMRPLVRIARDTDCALVILHHATKADGSYRDSTEIGAAADVLQEMAITEGGIVRQIKYWGRFGRGSFALKLVGGEFELVTETDGSDLERRVLAFVEAHLGCSQRAVESGIGKRVGDVRQVLRELVVRGEIDDRGNGRNHEYYPRQGASQAPDAPAAPDPVRPLRPAFGTNDFEASRTHSAGVRPIPIHGWDAPSDDEYLVGLS